MKVSEVKVLGIGFVRLEDFVCDAHVRPPLDSAWYVFGKDIFSPRRRTGQMEKGQVLG